MPVTPEQVETRLRELSREVDEGHSKLENADKQLVDSEFNFKMGMAEERLRISHSDQKMRVGEIEDRALVINKDAYNAYLTAQQIVRAAKSNADRVHTQVQIAQSLGASVRSSLNL